MLDQNKVKEIWRTADAVCFDVDSTVCVGEGIDELASYCGVGKEVAEWTNKAMGEGISFRDALNERLKIIRPTREKVKEFVTSSPPKLTAGISELVSCLRKQNKEVYLVSGGFWSLIKPVAETLEIPERNVFCNKIFFDDSGLYKGFDETQPTSSSGGKKIVVEKLKNQYKYQRLVVIGDGMTDLETYPLADLFIGFGGNCVRQKVKERAPWYVTTFQELLDELL